MTIVRKWDGSSQREKLQQLDYNAICRKNNYAEVSLYSLHPKLLECFDWNRNIKESMRNL
jgi:hypothetical protein